MTREQVLQILAKRRIELRQRFGVRSLALFGSLARNEATETSDIDFLVEFERPVGLFHIFRVEEFLEKCLDGANVDLVLRQAVIDELKDIIYGEAIDVAG